MRLFDVQLTDGKTIQLACDTRHTSAIAKMLDASTIVDHYDLAGQDHHLHHHPKMGGDKSPSFIEALIAAIEGSNEPPKSPSLQEFLASYGCKQEGWTGSPGDFSPPDCNCEKCIAEGKAYRYNTYELQLPPYLHKHFQDILRPLQGTKSYRWGIEHVVPGKARIAVHDRGIISIHSNKETIRIGCYVFNHTNKTITAAP